jgi:hypothetical protein
MKIILKDLWFSGFWGPSKTSRLLMCIIALPDYLIDQFRIPSGNTLEIPGANVIFSIDPVFITLLSDFKD